jgi:hypothetical protein
MEIDRPNLYDTMSDDSQFLASQGIMDYSLLLVREEVEEGQLSKYYK